MNGDAREGAPDAGRIACADSCNSSAGTVHRRVAREIARAGRIENRYCMTARGNSMCKADCGAFRHEVDAAGGSRDSHAVARKPLLDRQFRIRNG
jgi:hypothetical protein